MRSFCVEMKRLLFLPVLFFILFSGCSKIDPKIEPASYIEISDYSVITDSVNLKQGTSHQKFTNVLVTSKTKNYGYYPIPCKIPLPLEGETYLNIRAAILVNGVKFLRVDYPVMKGFDTTVNLVKGQVTRLKPVFQYYSTADFPLVEDFEGTTFTVTNSSATDTFCTKIDTANAAFGNSCLSIKLDAAHPVCQVQSTSGFYLPNDGPNIYLEFNYKSNYPIEVGLIGSSTQGVILNSEQRSAGGANASAGWNKIYIDMTNIVRTPPYHNFYFLYLYTSKGFDPGVGYPLIYVDNLKVVHQ